MAHPDGGMFSIKLTHPEHLTYAFLTPDPSDPGGHPRLMNFSDQGNTPVIARGIRRGHRAIVYIIHRQKFVWAIEYTGTVDDGPREAARLAFPLDVLDPEWSEILLPIRFLATIDIEAAPDAAAVCYQAGVDFRPNQFPMKHISGAEYRRLYNAIRWQWEA